MKYRVRMLGMRTKACESLERARIIKIRWDGLGHTDVWSEKPIIAEITKNGKAII